MSRLSEITQDQRTRLSKNAAKAQASSLPFIRFEEGFFKLGTTNVTGADFMAVPDRCDVVWNYYSGGVEEILRVNLLDNAIPKRPDVHNDRSYWEKDARGKPKDPLGMQFELPLVADDDGRVIVFKASTKPAKESVGRLLNDFAEKLRRPFVTLSVKVNPDNVHQMVPELTVTGYSDDLEDVALPGFGVSSGGTATNGAKPVLSNSDMDDAIPF